MSIYDDLDWRDAPEYSKGTQMKILRDEAGAKTILLKLPPGFSMAPHSHVTAEQHILISGAYSSDGVMYTAGTYRKFSAHEDHGPFESKQGALVLVIWDPFKNDN